MAFCISGLDTRSSCSMSCLVSVRIFVGSDSSAICSASAFHCLFLQRLRFPSIAVSDTPSKTGRHRYGRERTAIEYKICVTARWRHSREVCPIARPAPYKIPLTCFLSTEIKGDRSLVQERAAMCSNLHKQSKQTLLFPQRIQNIGTLTRKVHGEKKWHGGSVAFEAGGSEDRNVPGGCRDTEGQSK